MRKFVKMSLTVILALFFCTVVPLYAHHSQAMFDLTKTITIEGVVTQVDWANPHVFFYVDAKKAGVDNDRIQNWALEGQSPAFLKGNGDGWQSDSIKVGEKIGATGNARKDGKPMMLLLYITLSDGRKLTSKSPYK